MLFESPEIIYPCGVSFSCAYRVKSLKVLSNRNKSSKSFQSSSFNLRLLRTSSAARNILILSLRFSAAPIIFAVLLQRV